MSTTGHEGCALTPAESARLDKTPTSSLQAYDLYLKSEALREVEPEPNREAIALLGRRRC